MERQNEINALREALAELVNEGRIGNFDHLEVVEVVATPPGAATRNVLSIAILGEGYPQPDIPEKPKLSGRIKIDGFKGWSFGVVQLRRNLSSLDQVLRDFSSTGRWALSGQFLQVGALRPQPVMFVPPDGSLGVPINRILKNNFWAGSHVFRLADLEKRDFAPFFDDRRKLQVLSDAISQIVPIAFAGLSDFLGDVVIQVPVLNLVTEITSPRGASHIEVEANWRSQADARPLAAAARTRWDEVLTGAAMNGNFRKTARLDVNGHRQPIEAEIWDTQRDVLIAATAVTSTIKRAQLAIHMIELEPRIFLCPDTTGEVVAQRVTLTTTTVSGVGELPTSDAAFWLGRRQDLEEKQLLEGRRQFVQYRPDPGSQSEHIRALDDLRWLIQKHGTDGVDLWDPYLSANDILQTLFWCKHSGATLRALTDGRDPPGDKRCDGAPPEDVPTQPSFSDRQRATLEESSGNQAGLRLEYKTRRGPKGWAFHDRFLIFPNEATGPSAWSIGTSINSVGKAHHILQQVSNPALIAGAFKDLWEALDEEQHVIWRSS